MNDNDGTKPLELFDTTLQSTGTTFQRQRTGTFASDDLDRDGPPESVFRDEESGLFVSKDRSPVPQRRETETGEVFTDTFAIGVDPWGDD